ncbi:haloacid dehalogenase, type II [Exophiala spinifera]|uniref:Haloacid dehalogenase, type II n=1 Tax=Exophiala spinifera TaxID=91928 RepID=A0A0D2B4E5_9EURO|nr:haloacid dehalogenase, type II [Exophiala spinifera]KIW13530.1 haloacid dehalogenase, type II [Exophiala spinifera]
MAAPIKAILFDFIGTCLDWHSSIVKALPSELSETEKSTFALEWRQAYFDYNTKRLAEGEPVEDFDDSQRWLLDAFLDRTSNLNFKKFFSTQVKEHLVSAWHHQDAWPDVAEALSKLKSRSKLEVYVHANGSTRLQLDLVKSAGLHYDMLFSSELLGLYKPAPESYRAAMKLLKLKPDECVMVAAHASDLRGAKAVGMKTVYVYRWTDDIREDQEVVKRENDAYLLDMRNLDGVIANLRGPAGDQ